MVFQSNDGRRFLAGVLKPMEMFQVDAFTNRLFAGNPAAVLILEEWLPDALLLAITQENNLSETAFVKASSNKDWDLRWFSPAHEVDFCGHATLAAAHVLLTENREQGPLVFHTRVGELRVSKEHYGYRLDLPCLMPTTLGHLPPEISHIFDKPPARIFRNFENIFVDLGSADAVRRYVPDLPAITLLGSVGLVVTGEETNCGHSDFVSRYFAPGAGIPEDPVTGSIHATLVPYWANRLNKNKLTAFQASSRGGVLECELNKDRVYLTGNAITFMKANILINISDYQNPISGPLS